LEKPRKESVMIKVFSVLSVPAKDAVDGRDVALMGDYEVVR
jgi:hypothetical protein